MGKKLNKFDLDYKQLTLQVGGSRDRRVFPAYTIKVNGIKVCPQCLKTPTHRPLPTCCEGHQRTFLRRMKAQKKWQDNHVDAFKIKLRKERLQRYGITEDQLEEMLRQQNGRCAICQRDINLHIEINSKTGGNFKRREYYIDHDHRTNAVRSLICTRCNFMIGYAQDNVEILQSAVTYLQKWRSHNYIKPGETIEK